MNRLEVEKNWKERGFNCGLWVDPPGQEWRDFVHPMDELLMVIEGELELEMDGKCLLPKVGQEVLIPANTLHTVRNRSRFTARWLYGYKGTKRTKPSGSA